MNGKAERSASAGSVDSPANDEPRQQGRQARQDAPDGSDDGGSNGSRSHASAAKGGSSGRAGSGGSNGSSSHVSDGGDPTAEQAARDVGSTGNGPAKPQTHAEQAERKKRVLTQGTASTVRSIADAIVAKDGEPFLICPPDGSISTNGDHGYGLYYHDCRFLCGYELRVAGQRLSSLAATAAAGTHAALELTNPAIGLPGGGKLAKETLTVRWDREVDGSAARLRDRISFRSFRDGDLSFPVSISFAARFEDIFLIRGLLDDHRGHLHDPRWDGDRLVFSYDGRDKLRRTLEVTTSPAPSRRHDDGVEFDVKLGGRGETTLEITVSMGEEVLRGGKPIEQRARPGGDRPAHRSAQLGKGTREQDWVGGEGWDTQVRSDSYLLDAVLARSLDDLRLLRASIDGLPYYEAGIPWFATLFGRDSIIASLQTLAFDASVAKGTLRLLASMQGTKVDDWRDEQPGKILHELRIGELARIAAIPHTPYYGTVDATPLFLILLEQYVAWTGDMELFGELRGHVDSALEWLDRWGDSTHDGFIDYQSEQGHGLVNQGWKDSGDGIVDAHGRIADAPIALVEVQGYAYAARRGMADLFERAGDPKVAADQRRKAQELRDRFEREFWSDRLGTYMLAKQHDGRPCDVVTSNAGQVLWSGIASDDHASRTAERLLRDDMYDGWGIRTLSSEAVAFNPIGYHLGTVWPHDNGIIAAGFRRYGLDHQSERVFTGLLETAADFPHFRLPECFAGYGRNQFGIPVRYPVACHPQAWAAGSIPHLLTTTLGLEPDASAGRLRVARPILPAFVDSLELRGLRVGKGRVDLRFSEAGRGVDVEVVSTEGGLDVQVEDGGSHRHRSEGRAGRARTQSPSKGSSAGSGSSSGNRRAGHRAAEADPEARDAGGAGSRRASGRAATHSGSGTKGS